MKNVIQKKEWKDERITETTENCHDCGTEIEKCPGPYDEAALYYTEKYYCPECGAYNIFRF